MRQLISYPITIQDPVWPGNPALRLESHSAIGPGSASNSYRIFLHNHCGTHFDAPRHFNPNGAAIAELPLDAFFYGRPLLLDIPKGSCEKILPADLEPFEEQIASCDLLMLRTGFAAMREENPALYCQQGPAVSSSAARYLMDRFSNIKALALDFISLACYSDREDGVLAHQYLLGMHHPHAVCIIEDVNMRQLPGEVCRAAAIPLLIEGVDSGQVTMWAEWE